MSMKALVTGGAGFIGSNLVLALQEKGHEVVAMDNNLNNNPNLAGFEGEAISANILDFDYASLRPDIIFHQAAITDTTVKDKELMMSVNVGALKRVLDYCIANNIQLIYASSAAVYGNIPGPQAEAQAGRPNNLYGISKWDGDRLAMKYLEKGTITGLRYFNVFGPREAHKGKMASMIYQLYLQMKQNKRPRIFRDGEQKRDHIYVKDVIAANLDALKAQKSCIVNVGTGIATTFNTIIRELNTCIGTELKPDYFENPYTGSYQDFTQADLTLAKKCIGYVPAWRFAEGVKDYVEFLAISSESR